MTKSKSVSVVVIPARLASVRLPGKLLLSATGKPLLQHTYEAAKSANRPAMVSVATEDGEIYEAVKQFGGDVLMTSPGLTSGTARVAEIAAAMEEVDIFVNVQGDEPEIAGAAIDQLIGLLENNPETQMATLAAPIRHAHDLHDPACVKVVTDHLGQAIYFSRSPIPYPRGGVRPQMFANPPAYWQHIGVYAYRREFLLGFNQLPISRLAEIECLEQLTVLETGTTIRVCTLEQATHGIDTPEDYDRFLANFRQRQAVA